MHIRASVVTAFVNMADGTTPIQMMAEMDVGLKERKWKKHHSMFGAVNPVILSWPLIPNFGRYPIDTHY